MRVRVLGPLEVDGPRGPVVVAGARQRTVLAVLALAGGRPVPVARLIDALWPDDPPPSARNSLQSHVARLRPALPPGALTLGPAGYRLAVTPSEVDALLFCDLLRRGELDRALGLWRGPPLPEFAGEPLRSWAVRLREAWRGALADRAERDGRDDGLADAVDEDPCWERGATVLATVLAGQGRAGEASSVLRRHAEAVVGTLGVDPSRAVRELQAALLGGDHRLRPAAAQRPGAGAPAASSRRGVAVPVPSYSSVFVGRDRERTALAELLATARCVTVTGPGGVGKTRLVAEAVRDLEVAWVDAAAVRGRDDFLQAVAVATGARPAPGDDVVAVIAAGTPGATIVLDNCEHVLTPAAELVEAVAAAGARVIVTSQERLRADGERVLVLPPLTPAAATALFLDRSGGAVDPADPSQAAAVAQLVVELDLLPLAIELAATQAPALGVVALRDRLDDRLDLLTRGRRTGAPRQRTLRAVVDWSFGLLPEAEKEALARLGVFAGPFTVELAEAVLAGPGLPRSRVAAVLAALVDRSLVSRAGPGRLRLLETVRAYAAELPVPAEIRDRHAAAVVAAADDIDRRLRGPDEALAVRDMDALLPDLRQAATVARGDLLGRLAAAVYRYGYHCQRYEALAWGYAGACAEHPAALAAAATHAWGHGGLETARALLESARPHPSVHEVLGDIALVACDGDAALRHYRESARLAGDAAVRAAGLAGQAMVLAWISRPGEAAELGRTAVAVADACGNPTARAAARYGLGEALGDVDPERAVSLLDEAAALARDVDNRLFEAAASSAAGAIRSRHGDPEPALRRFRAALALLRRAGNETLQAAALRNLVVLLARIGEDETAALLDAALPAAKVYPAEAARLGRARAAVAERLGPAGVAAADQRAGALTPGQVVDAALGAIDAALGRPANSRSRSGAGTRPPGGASLPLSGV